jgi:Cu-processing system ATP-binding protein
VRTLAPAATWAGAHREGPSGRDEELIVPGPAALRPRVLDAVRALGVEVRGLTAEEGRLDVLYRELIAEAESRPGHSEAQ